MIAEDVLEPESYTARTSPYPAREVDEERVIRVHDYLSCNKLPRESPSRYGIAEEEGDGILIIHEVRGRIRCCLLTSLCDRYGIIRCVLVDRDTAAA